MGVQRPTVTYNIMKAEELLTIAVAEMLSPEKQRHKSEEPEPEPEVTEEVAKRREMVKQLLETRSKIGFRVYRTARDIHEVLLCDGEISLRSIQRDCQILGFPYRVRQRTSPLNEDRAQKRVEFAQRILSTFSPEMFRRLCFSDESYIHCEDLQRGMRVGPGEEPEPRRTDGYSKKKVYVWGAIGVDYRQLVILPSYTNAEDYEDTLKRFYMNDPKSANHIFMQDGAPPHRACVDFVRSRRGGRLTAQILTPSRTCGMISKWV